MLRLRRNSAFGIATHTVLALLLCAGIPPASAKTFTKKTKHYEVATDVSLEFTKLVSEHMEQILAEYKRRLPGFECDIEEPFQVMVFKNNTDYNKALPSRLQGSTGAFVARLKLLATHLEDRTREEAFRTLYHEGFHQFMYLCISQDCPLWVNEALAEYFAEATWNGKGFDTGQLPPERLTLIQQKIREKQHLPFKTLFAMESEKWLRNMRVDKSRASLQYSQAWSIVHFLIHAEHGQHREKLLQYLKDIASRTDHEVALEHSFGRDLAAFQRAWRRYMMGLKPDPKYTCKRNMMRIMLLGLRLYGHPERFGSLVHLRRRLLYDRRLKWSVTSSNGGKVSSDDRQQAADLFVCPYDGSKGETSYILLKNPRTGLPMLFCTHHRGVVMKAYYKRTPQKDYEAEVEEQVIATLPADLRRALVAKMR